MEISRGSNLADCSRAQDARTCVFDGDSVFCRSWHASNSAGHGLRDAAGRPVSGISASFWVVLSLLDPRKSKLGGKIDRVLFCWDAGSKRKKPRPTKPDAYYDERARFMELVQLLLGAANAVSPGYEADDCVATAVYRELENRRSKIYVVSGDKDLQQLHGGLVGYYCLNEKALLSSSFISHRWGVKRPVQVAIALAILGDPGDAVPGLRGWGPKKVEKLFERVSPDMNFKQALDVVDRQIPSELKAAFYESLDLTLLDPSVPGVPEPAPLAWGDGRLFERDLRLAELGRYFNHVKHSYVGCLHEAGPETGGGL